MFSTRLKLLRKSRRLTQEELADKLHISRSAIAQYEVGKRIPEYSTLKNMADYFEVSIDYLVGRTDQEQAVLDEHLSDQEYERFLNQRQEFIEEQRKIFILKQVVEKYNFDISNPEDMRKLEDVIKLVVDFRKDNQQE